MFSVKKWITVYLNDGRRVIEKVECDRKGTARSTLNPELIHHTTMGFNLNYRWDDMLREWILYPYDKERVEMARAMPAGMRWDTYQDVLKRYHQGQLGEKDLGVTPLDSGFPITIRTTNLEKFWDRVFP